ncbi:MAG: transposase [Methanosarcinales archaeon]
MISHTSIFLETIKKAKELGIYLIFLPPYSPDLNPIEYIWKSIKRMLSNHSRSQKAYLYLWLLVLNLEVT